MLDVRQTELPGVLEITPEQFSDERGFFSETWNAQSFTEAGLVFDFVQDNHCYSRDKGVLRGLHYQIEPFAQDKLVRVTRGRAFDVVVDIRKGSPTYAKWMAVELSAQEWNQLLVPRGFAHGYMTLESNTELLYKVTNYYSRECDRSIRFDDPAIGIEWPLPSDGLILSDRDRNAPLLAAADNGFEFEE